MILHMEMARNEMECVYGTMVVVNSGTGRRGQRLWVSLGMLRKKH